MTTNQHDPVTATQRPSGQRLEAVVRGRVIELLGPAGAGLTVRVRHLWAGNYRVNVFVGEASAFAEIAQSYFVSADENGNILESTPAVRAR